MQSKNIVPIVTTDKLTETRAFYVDKLGLQLSFEHDMYLGVRTGDKDTGAAEIGFMKPEETCPGQFDGVGMTFGITVEDADAECERLRSAGIEIQQEPADMPWGARAFAITDPNGVMLFVSHPIPAAMEYAECIR